MLMILKQYGLYLMDDCERVNLFGLNFEFEVAVNEEKEYSFCHGDTTLLPPSNPIMFLNDTSPIQLTCLIFFYSQVILIVLFYF